MDHKWGRDVFNYGLGDLGATLCSRFHPLDLRIVVTNASGSGAEVIAFQVPADTLSDAPYTQVGFFPTAPHFPYGLIVDDDAP